MKTTLLRSLRLCVSAVLLGLHANAATVIFTNSNFFGSAVNNQITIQPRTHGHYFGLTFVSDAPKVLQPVNGILATNLLPITYQVDIEGIDQTFFMNVPDDTNTYSALDLINQGASMDSPRPALAVTGSGSLTTNYVAGRPVNTINIVASGGTNVANIAGQDGIAVTTNLSTLAITVATSPALSDLNSGIGTNLNSISSDVTNYDFAESETFELKHTGGEIDYTLKGPNGSNFFNMNSGGENEYSIWGNTASTYLDHAFYINNVKIVGIDYLGLYMPAAPTNRFVVTDATGRFAFVDPPITTDASLLTSGTIPDGRISANFAKLASANTWTSGNTFNTALTLSTNNTLASGIELSHNSYYLFKWGADTEANFNGHPMGLYWDGENGWLTINDGVDGSTAFFHGQFSGDGQNLNLNASHIIQGIVPDASLSLKGYTTTDASNAIAAVQGATSAATANALVKRDGSGNFAASGITASNLTATGGALVNGLIVVSPITNSALTASTLLYADANKKISSVTLGSGLSLISGTLSATGSASQSPLTTDVDATNHSILNAAKLAAVFGVFTSNSVTYGFFTNLTVLGTFTGNTFVLTEADITTINLSNALNVASGGSGTATWTNGTIPVYSGTNLPQQVTVQGNGFDISTGALLYTNVNYNMNTNLALPTNAVTTNILTIVVPTNAQMIASYSINEAGKTNYASFAQSTAVIRGTASGATIVYTNSVVTNYTEPCLNSNYWTVSGNNATLNVTGMTNEPINAHVLGSYYIDTNGVPAPSVSCNLITALSQFSFNNNITGTTAGNGYPAQSFAVSTATNICHVDCFVGNGGGGTYNIEFWSTPDKSGTQYGSTVTFVASGSGFDDQYDVDMVPVVNLPAAGTYYLLIYPASSSATYNIGAQDGNPFAGGQAYQGGSPISGWDFWFALSSNY